MTVPQDSPPQAAIDVGSNTVRLLVAVPIGSGLFPILDVSRFVRLGSGVQQSGKLDPERRGAAIEAIRELAHIAAGKGAEKICAIATSAVRDARDGEEFASQVGKETGIDLTILSGEDEARLTFVGATHGMDLTNGAVVADIGGGSTEIISAPLGEIEWASSLQLGSGRLTENFVHHDPPTVGERQSISDHVSRHLRDLATVDAATVIFTGGTASHVAHLIGKTGGRVPVGREEIRQVEDSLYQIPMREIVSRYQIQPERAQVLPAGATALRTIMSWSEAPRVEITRSGIREGVILDSIRKDITE